MSVSRRFGLGSSLAPQNGPELTNDSSGSAGLRMELSGHIPGSAGGRAEAWYDAGPGNRIAKLALSSTVMRNISGPTWLFDAYTTDNDAGTTNVLQLFADQNDGSVSAQTFTTGGGRYIVIQFGYAATYTGDENERWRLIEDIAAIGDHGLPLRGTAPNVGFYASDIVQEAVTTWAPLLTTDVAQSSFVIPHAVFRDLTTASEIVRQVTRYGLEDWAVWADKTFVWHPRGAFARNWRARVGPSGLEETGPQVDRVWESVIVKYQDVDGTTRTVGPPGSGADTESSDLKDSDPENPANKLGITRRDLLSMGVGTVASATEVGRRFLEQTRLLDTSGRARLVGYVEDDHGVTFPFSAMRSGDTITFLDAADPSPRRIVRTDKDYSARACSVDLDAPPEGLAALLERLGVVLVPLGL